MGAGIPLTEVGPLAPEEVAGVVAALATTLAELHDKGVVHGGVDAAQPADDVAALGRLLTTLTRPLHRRRPTTVSLVLEDLARQATAADPARRPTARDLAAAIRERVPTARLPLRSASERRAWRWAGAAAAAATALGVALMLSWPDSGPGSGPGSSPDPRPGEHARRPPRPAAAPRPAVPTARRVWPVVQPDFHDGVLTVGGARYAVGRSGDTAVAGDWSCSGGATVALLRPSTGDVVVFEGWAEEHREVTGRLVARVPGATGLTVGDTDGDGCDDLQATRPGAAPVPVDTRTPKVRP